MSKQYTYIERRIPATPRNKRLTDAIAAASLTGGGYIGGGGGASYWQLVTTDADGNALAEEDQYLVPVGNYSVVSTADVVAYSKGDHDIVLPIASASALGAVMIGEGLRVDDEGKVHATSTGGIGGIDFGGEGNVFSEATLSADGKKITFTRGLTALTTENYSSTLDEKYVKIDGNAASATKLQTARRIWGQLFDGTAPISGDMTEVGSITASGTIKTSGDVIAYSTGSGDIALPIASSSALGAIKVGKNLTITDDGTLNAEAGGVSSWNDLTDKPTTLAGYGITDAVKASDFTTHIKNTAIHITADERTNWNDTNSKKHTHNNKTVIDGITSDNVTNWNDANSKKHSHSNKSVIDGISSTNVSNWNDANAKKHTHSNKSYLDSINQNLSKTSDVTFKSVAATGEVIAYSTGSGDITLPIASSSALGAIKVGNGLSIDSNGVLSATGAGSIAGIITSPNTGNVLTGATLSADGKTITFTKNLTAITTANYTTTLDTRYVKKSGDTMTGALVLPAGSTSATDKGLRFPVGSTNYTALRHNGTDALVISGAKADDTIYIRPNGTSSTTGEATLDKSGNFATAGDVIAYSTGSGDITLPIASSTALGTIKVGSGLSIASDGTLSATGSGSIAGINISPNTGNVLTGATLSADGKTITFAKDLTALTTANYASTLDSKYLKLTGGALTGALALPTGSSSNTDKGLRFSVGGTHYTVLRYNGTDALILSGAQANDTIYFRPNGTGETAGQATLNTNGVLALSGQLTSSVATGTAPISVSSTTLCTNLNTDMLDGTHKDGLFTQFANLNDKVYITIGGNQKNITVAYATSAGKLSTSHTFWGKTFNGTQDVSGDMTGVGSITASGVIKTTSDVIAYSTGSQTAPFKYWYPSVDDSGNISWVDSVSTTNPKPKNIRGPKGDKGTSISKVEQTTTSTADGGTNKITCTLSDGTTSTFSIKNGSKGSTGATGPQGPAGPTGATGPAWSGGTISSDIRIQRTNAGLYLAYGAGTNAWRIWQNSSGSYNLYFQCMDQSSAAFYITKTGSYGKPSDIRLKNVLYDVTDVLSKIDTIKPFYYTLKDDNTNETKIGISAQDLNVVYPELVLQGEYVKDWEDYCLGVDYSTLSVIAIQAVRELHALVKSQQSKIDELEKRLSIWNQNNYSN